jgi:hypothetical protein
MSIVNVYGVNATKGLPTTSGSVHSRMVDGNESNGSVKWLHDTYEATTVSGQSTITFGKLPDSCWVIGGNITFDTCSGTQMEIGVSADSDKFAAATTLTSTASVSFSPVYVSASDYVMLTVVSGTQPYTGSIEVNMLFVE